MKLTDKPRLSIQDESYCTDKSTGGSILNRLIRLEIINFKNIEYIVIEPGKTNQIVGPNSQGKTAIINALDFLIAGSTNEDLVKLGQEKTEVIGTWDNDMIVHRYLKRREGKKATTDVSIEVGGMVPKKKQDHLNGLIGIGSFNPREVLDPKTRNNFIMDLIDIKITEDDLKEALKTINVTIPELNYDMNALKVIEQASASFYSARTDRNRDTKEALQLYNKAKGDLPEKPKLLMPDSTYECLSAQREGLADEFRGLSKKVSDWESEDKEINGIINESRELIKASANIEDEIAALKEKHVDNEVLLQEKTDEAKTRSDALGEKPDVLAETKRITDEGTKISEELQRHNDVTAVEKQEEIVDSLAQAHKRAKDKSDALDLAVNTMRGPFKKQVMESANLPIKSLTYEDGIFKIGGRSIDLLSGSEALIIGLQLTRLKNPTANVICIDGGECLDAEGYAKLQAAITDDQFSYFITKVGEPYQNDIDKIIKMENGAVVHEENER